MSNFLFTSPASVLKIATFDSGVGGYHITDKLYRLSPYYNLIPHEIIHIADTKNLPYGTKNSSQIIQYVSNIAFYTLSQGCDYFIICCNTASVHYDAIVEHLSQRGVNNAADKIISLKSFTYKILNDFCLPYLDKEQDIHLLFLATRATITSRNYVNYLIERYNLPPCESIVAQTHDEYLTEQLHFETALKTKIHITQFAPLKWVSMIESDTDTQIIQDSVRDNLSSLTDYTHTPFSAVGLFCTHYPLIKQEILNGLMDLNPHHHASIFLSQTDGVVSYIFDILKTDSSQDVILYNPKIYVTDSNDTDFKHLFARLFPQTQNAEFIPLSSL